MLGVKVFVFCVFLLIGVSFVAPTAALVVEFANADWLVLATFYSHLFVFFPTLGLVTLFAFYMPACVFTHMYWSQVRLGRTRFIVGGMLVLAVSVLLAQSLSSGRERSIFEISPRTLAADTGEPAGCGSGQEGCQRLGILAAADNVRSVSQQRIGLTDLARSCRVDPLIEATPVSAQRKRFCFASTPLGPGAPLSSDAACCRAQHAFGTAIEEMYRPVEQHSLTGRVHHAALVGKVFFMLILLLISVLLALRLKGLKRHYAAYLTGIERGVLIGAAAMVIYPIMSHAFLQSAALLYGAATETGYRTTAPVFTAVFGAWALLLTFFFFRSRDRDMQMVGRLGSAMAGGFAVLKYEQIVDLFVRVFGAGASLPMLGAVAAASIMAVVVLFTWTSEEMAVAPTPSQDPAPN